MRTSTSSHRTVPVRERTRADVPACVQVLRAVHENDAYPLVWPANPARWLSPQRQHRAWVSCSADGEVTGHIALSDLNGHPMADPCMSVTGRPVEQLVAISRLFVSPAWRHRGLATRLLAVASRDAHSYDRWPVLDVSTENTGALALYRRLGWNEIARITIGSAPGFL